MRTHVPVTAALAVLLGLTLTACSSGSSSDSSSAARATPTSSSGAKLAVVTTAPALASPATTAADGPAPSSSAAKGATAKYRPVAEPFSPPGTCNSNGSTLEMTACVLEQVVDVDSSVDQLQLDRFELAPASKQAALLADDAKWSKHRSATCNATATSGGTLDQLTVAQCLLKVGQARVKALKKAAGN
jgi:uncharacterized protein YecT (DUF1311 family)